MIENLIEDAPLYSFVPLNEHGEFTRIHTDHSSNAVVFVALMEKPELSKLSSFESESVAEQYIMAVIRSQGHVRFGPDDPIFAMRCANEIAKTTRRGQGNRRRENIIGYVGGELDAAIFLLRCNDQLLRPFFAPGWRDYYRIIG